MSRGVKEQASGAEKAASQVVTVGASRWRADAAEAMTRAHSRVAGTSTRLRKDLQQRSFISQEDSSNSLVPLTARMMSRKLDPRVSTRSSFKTLTDEVEKQMVEYHCLNPHKPHQKLFAGPQYPTCAG